MAGLEQEIAIFEKGEDDDGTGMNDVFPKRLLAVGKPYCVLADFQQLALENDFTGKFRFDEVCVVRHLRFWN